MEEADSSKADRIVQQQEKKRVGKDAGTDGRKEAFVAKNLPVVVRGEGDWDSDVLFTTTGTGGEMILSKAVIEKAMARNSQKNMQELAKKYNELREKYEKLLEDSEKLKNDAILPHVWVPYVKLTFLWVATALVLLALAEQQFQNGYEVAFGVFAALGGTGFFMAIPITHLIGRWLYSDYQIFQPFKGGIRFVILQALSWSFYGMTAVIVLFSVVYAEKYTSGMMASGGVIGILSQVFMISSLLTFDSSNKSGPTDMKFFSKYVGNLDDDDDDDYDSDSSQSARDKIQGQVGKGKLKRVSSFETHANSLIDVNMTSKANTADHQISENENWIVSQFLRMNLALVMVGMVLALMAEHTNDWNYRSGLVFFSFMCCTVGVFLTHGLGGLFHHGEKGWRFSQFFRGGPKFVALQIIGWCSFGIALSIQGLVLLGSAYGSLYFGKKFFHSGSGSMYIAGFAALFSQLIIRYSLRHFEEDKDFTKPVALSPTKYRELPKYSWSEGTFALLLITVFSNTQYVYIFSYLTLLELPHMLPKSILPALHEYTFTLIPDIYQYDPVITPLDSFVSWWIFFASIVIWVFLYSGMKNFEIPNWVTSIILACTASTSLGWCLRIHADSPHYAMLIAFAIQNLTYMATTHTKLPEYNACREWPAFRQSRFIFDTFESYFGLEIKPTEELEKIAPLIGSNDAPKELQQLMIGFHPHGIFPMTHIWLSSSPTWRRIFPNFHVNPLTASVVHVVPVMRDVSQWCGVCDVSKRSVQTLLSMKKNVAIVIGGQTEMFESRSWDKEIMIVRKKRKGVFKIAIQHGLGILPMWCFGEPQAMDNVYLPTIQQWMKNHFGFPVPYVPYGRFFLPLPAIPRRVPLTVVMDVPVYPKRQCNNPSTDEIVDLQTRYFCAVENLFEKEKHKYGHSEYSIRWMDH